MIEHLAVVGATGAVGREACALITQRRLHVGRISLLASPRGAGTRIAVNGQSIEVRELTESSFAGVDFAIFTAGSEASKRWAPVAKSAGAVVIDNSSAFRADPEVPLVIPEVNPGDLEGHDGIIANPNCSTIIMNVAVWPLHRINPVERIVVSTYQAASGAGGAAMEELRTQTADYLASHAGWPTSSEVGDMDSGPFGSPTAKAMGHPGQTRAGARLESRTSVAARVFEHPIAFNLFSHDSPIGADGYNSEERKMINETRKIFHERSLAITATCIRVPVLRAHSESINLTFERPITPDEVRQILSGAPGIEVVDDMDGNRFPMPIDASGRDEVLVGRIRRDVSQPDNRGIDLFACSDQLRKGAALNAIQILELLTNRTGGRRRPVTGQ